MSEDKYKELRRLHKEVSISNNQVIVWAIFDKVPELLADLDTAMKALEYYAGPDCGMSGQSIIKEGFIARKALEKIRDK